MICRTRSALLLALLASPLLPAQTYRGMVGAEVEIGEGNRSRAFVDIAKTFRPMDSTPTDDNGWPTADFQMLFFDNRPYAAWDPATGIDDPERFIPDWSGTYHLSFTGQATIASAADPVTIANQAYDAASNTSTADVTLTPATATFVLSFTATKRTASSSTGSGVTNIRVIRPGYPANSAQVYTDEFLNALKPFSHLRFMGVLDTNSADAAYDATKTLQQNQKQWSDRHLLSDATQQSYGNKHGLAWEYIIQLANLTGKDIWINVPASASDDYVRQLAMLMSTTLKPGIRIYIENGNEVWNSSFSAYKWNVAAAQAEVKAGNSKLDQNPAPPHQSFPSDADEVAQRRHARRVAEIGKIFLSVYGNDAFGKIIRPVYAGWTILPSQYQRVLTWIKNNVGDPATLYYGIAQTHYYNDAAVHHDGATVQDEIDAMRADSDSNDAVGFTNAIHNVATSFGVKQVIYEAGPDISRGVAYNTPASKVPSIASAIGACRDAQMHDLVLHDAKDNWFAKGGAEYTYFTMSGGASRWGCWGALEDVVGDKANSPKYQALQELVGGPYPAPSIDADGVVNAATYAAPITSGGFATIFGKNFADKVYGWDGAIAGGLLPRVVGQVAVNVNGMPAVIVYSSATQINIIVPPDVLPGQATIEVIAPGGKTTATAQAAAASPGLFGNTLNGQFQLTALFANTRTYVAPVGAWPGLDSRPAKAGDYLELYGTGLGLAGSPFGTVLNQPYPIDASLVTLTMAGKPAKVLFAGMTYAGLFQINVQVPDGVPPGNQPVVLKLANQTSKTDAVLTFQ